MNILILKHQKDKKVSNFEKCGRAPRWKIIFKLGPRAPKKVCPPQKYRMTPTFNFLIEILNIVFHFHFAGHDEGPFVHCDCSTQRNDPWGRRFRAQPRDCDEGSRKCRRSNRQEVGDRNSGCYRSRGPSHWPQNLRLALQGHPAWKRSVGIESLQHQVSHFLLSLSYISFISKYTGVSEFELVLIKFVWISNH